MYQRGTIPPAATGVPDLAARWRETLTGSWPRIFNPALYLPDNFASFLLFMLGLIGVAAALSLHLLLSAQIMTAQVELENLTLEYDRINQQNMEIIWQTSQNASLANVQNRAAQLGYNVIPQKVYRLRRPLLEAANGMPGATTLPLVSPNGTLDRSNSQEIRRPINGIRNTLSVLNERWQGWMTALEKQLTPMEPN